MRLDPGCVTRIENDAGHRIVKLLLDVFGGIALENSGLGLDDLRQRPERHRFAVRKRTSAPPVREDAAMFDHLQELVHEAWLPDPRNADKRDELRRRLLADTDEQLRQKPPARVPLRRAVLWTRPPPS